MAWTISKRTITVQFREGDQIKKKTYSDIKTNINSQKPATYIKGVMQELYTLTTNSYLNSFVNDTYDIAEESAAENQ